MAGFVTVKKAAKWLGVSEQRVRVLLSSGRLSGAKDDRNIWRVQWPAEVSFGRRGPALGLSGSDRFIVQRLFNSRVRVFDAKDRG